MEISSKDRFDTATACMRLCDVIKNGEPQAPIDLETHDCAKELQIFLTSDVAVNGEKTKIFDKIFEDNDLVCNYHIICDNFEKIKWRQNNCKPEFTYSNEEFAVIEKSLNVINNFYKKHNILEIDNLSITIKR